MSIAADTQGPRPAALNISRPRPRTLVLGGLLALALGLVFAGYVLHVSWIGLNGHTATLWQWLNLVLFPLAIAVVPIVYLRRGTVRLPDRATIVAATAAAGLFVLASYLVPLRWTGFAGNTLWDWCKLLLPVAAVLSVACPGSLRSELRADHGLRLALPGAALAVSVLGGYLWGWQWTGFAGQTLWDWLRLLLLPIAIPTLVAPALTAIAQQLVAGELVARAAATAPDRTVDG